MNLFGAPKGAVVDNELHIIGSQRHFKYDASDLAFIALAPIEDWFTGHGLVKAKHKLLAFGGISELVEFPHAYSRAIHEYDTMHPERGWTNLEAKLSAGWRGVGCTPILQGEYVLVIGGEQIYDGDGEVTDEIQIYSVSERTIRTSSITCPLAGACQAVTVVNKAKDLLAAQGYIREQWSKCGLRHHAFPPQYLINLIGAHCVDEVVHIFNSDQDEEAEHFKISAFDIIR